jgi:hypothetical protein
MKHFFIIALLGISLTTFSVNKDNGQRLYTAGSKLLQAMQQTMRPTCHKIMQHEQTTKLVDHFEALLANLTLRERYGAEVTKTVAGVVTLALIWQLYKLIYGETVNVDSYSSSLIPLSTSHFNGVKDNTSNEKAITINVYAAPAQ